MSEIVTTEDVNKYIHEKIMGKCWHEPKQQSMEVGLRFIPCAKCGQLISRSLWEIEEVNPDYCSDDSPRRLLNEVYFTVKAIVGGTRIIWALEKLIERKVENLRHLRRGAPEYYAFNLLEASTEQVARACVEAHYEAHACAEAHQEAIR